MRFLILTSALFISACTSLSKDDCRAGNWHEFGRQDAMVGKSTEKFFDHEKVCAKYEAKPNKDAYLKGHEEGLKSYCTFENGFNVAESGRIDPGLCVGVQATEFQKGIEEGRRVYDLNKKIQDLDRRIQSLNGQIRHIDSIQNKNNDEIQKLKIELKKSEKQKEELEEKKLKL